MNRETTLQPQASETPEEAVRLRAREGVRVTWAAVAVNLLLTLMKGAAGWHGGSQALLADALNSLADVGTDAAILIALCFAARPPDRDHPYGHGRVESAAAFGMGLLVAVGGAALFFRAAGDLWTPRPYQPSPAVLPVILAAIALKEGLYRATVRVARRTGNQALLANAWNHRLDVFSSATVLAGVALALMGQWRADALAAAAVAGLAVWVGGRIVRNALDDLMDAAPPDEVVGRIRSAIEGVEGVHDVHALRVHRAGHHLFVDVHVEVASEISVADGHSIAHQGQDSVLSQVEEVSEVHVHIEPHRSSNP